MVAGEIVGFQEQEDPPAGLVADAALLRFVGGLRQQQANTAFCRADRHPALATAKIDVCRTG